jgi:hypothetical protein
MELSLCGDYICPIIKGSCCNKDSEDKKLKFLLLYTIYHNIMDTLYESQLNLIFNQLPTKYFRFLIQVNKKYNAFIKKIIFNKLKTPLQWLELQDDGLTITNSINYNNVIYTADTAVLKCMNPQCKISFCVDFDGYNEKSNVTECYSCGNYACKPCNNNYCPSKYTCQHNKPCENSEPCLLAKFCNHTEFWYSNKCSDIYFPQGSNQCITCIHKSPPSVRDNNSESDSVSDNDSVSDCDENKLTPNVLDVIVIGKHNYYYENKIDGNIYDEECKVVGIFKNGEHILFIIHSTTNGN